MVLFYLIFIFLSLSLLISGSSKSSFNTKPHIFFVIVDDFGHGNVGYHRVNKTDEVQTPNLDKLSEEGIQLDRHYVHMMCTPTRSSFYSGRLPIHVQLTLAGPCNPEGGIPRNMTGIATKMKQGGYKTNFVGKWDAGMATPTHTPKGRGFDESLNYFGHGNWMWSEIVWGGSQKNGTTPTTEGIIDFWNTDQPANHLNGTGYEEEIFYNRLTTIIQDHDATTPLFLVYAPRIAHYPLQVPEKYQKKFSFIDEPHRQVYHAMVNYLDDQMGEIVEEFKKKGMWDNTLMVLSSDNGGYVQTVGMCDLNSIHGTECFNGEAGANNYPLRGGKYTPWEGGVRANAFVSGGFVPEKVRGTKQEGFIHITDWYSTFCNLAGVDPTDTWAKESGLPPIDSLDVWDLISGENSTSPRVDVLIDENALIHENYKLVTGYSVAGSGWSGEKYPNVSSAGHEVETVHVNCENGCLFDVLKDPTEHVDLAKSEPELLKTLLDLKSELSKTIWHRNIPANDPDCEKTAESKYGGFLGPWKEVD